MALNDTDKFLVNDGTKTETVTWATVKSEATAGGSSFDGDYNSLTNKPDIPDSTSDLTNDSGFITASDIPTIPTVGDGTITIKQGGNTKGSFTTNQSGGSEINLDAGGVQSGSNISQFNNDVGYLTGGTNSVVNYQPISVTNGNRQTHNTQRGYTERANIWTGDFAVPDGANRMNIIWRARTAMKSNLTERVLDNYAVIWSQDVGIRLDLGSGASIQGSVDVAVDGCSIVQVNDRKQGLVLIRMNEVHLPGGTGRRISYNGKGYFQDAQGSGQGEVSWQSMQIYCVPFRI